MLKRSVELILVRGSNHARTILMSERGASKHGAGTIAFPGGHVEHLDSEERDETLCEAACREASEELGSAIEQAVRTAFDSGQVAVAAIVDDLRQHGSQYIHTAFTITVPEGVEPDAAAVDSSEHVDLRWRRLEEINSLVNSGRIYPPHQAQLHAYLMGGGRYIEQHD